MSLLAPVAGFLGLAIPAIIALYFLKIRRPTRVVPALHLWPSRVQDRQANVPWQRLRLSWLLVLQLLAAIFLVGAALEPALPAGATLARHTIVLLDASASMEARDVQPSRFDVARHQIGSLIDQLGAQDRMTLIAVGPTPLLLASAAGDQGGLHRALDAARPSNGIGDLSAALSLAAGLVRPGDDARAVLYSDGIFPPLAASFANGVPFPIDTVPVGASGENVAITSLSVRSTAASRMAYLRVQDFGQEARSVTIDWRVDGHLQDVRPVQLPAGQAADLVFSLPADATIVSAQLEQGDSFTLDDQGVAVARAPRTFKVLLVTPANLFLTQALRLRTDFQVDVEAPGAYHPDPAYALTVFDRFLPAQLPAGPMIVIDPPAGSSLAGGAPVGIGRVRAVDSDDPLLANVDLEDVHVARSQDLRTSTFGRPLIDSAQTPLILVRDEPYRQVLVGFDLHESDFPLRVAFPILMENLSEWMLPPSVPAHSFHPDETVSLVPLSGAQSMSVIRPDGTRRSLSTASIQTFGDTDELGVYQVEQLAQGQVQRSWFAVNLFSESVSHLQPVDRVVLPPTRIVGGQVTHRGLLDLWPWLALIGLGLLVAEWVAFHRGL
jgi:hypothetical protein